MTMRAEQQQMLMAKEELLRELRSKANELFLREQWARPVIRPLLPVYRSLLHPPIEPRTRTDSPSSRNPSARPSPTEPTSNLDLSDWVASRFRGEIPELAEYIGLVQIKKSEISGRGLFASKNIDAGTMVMVTRAIAIERGIAMGKDSGSGENKQVVMWKKFIDRVAGCVSKCRRIRHLINTLSSGEDEEGLETPDLSIFKAEASESDDYPNEKLDMNKILGILDVNSLVEDVISAKVMGRNKDYYGVGLWSLASFVNHSCCPNARRLHVGNHLMVIASRDLKAGEELTFAYFDVLHPPTKRRETAAPWGFDCSCKRCEFEEEMRSKQELRDIEAGLEGGMDVGGVVYRLEEGMRRWNARGKEKGYLRASFWAAYSDTYASEKSVKKWGRRIPAAEAVVDSVVEAAGSDERILKVLVERLSSRSGGGLGGGGVIGEMEKALKLGRGIYGKVVKKQALRGLIGL